MINAHRLKVTMAAGALRFSVTFLFIYYIHVGPDYYIVILVVGSRPSSIHTCPQRENARRYSIQEKETKLASENGNFLAKSSTNK